METLSLREIQEVKEMVSKLLVNLSGSEIIYPEEVANEEASNIVEKYIETGEIELW